MTPLIVAIVATYRRPHELGRLLDSLASLDPPLGALVVCDNEGSPATRAMVDARPFATHLLTPGENVGCSGGLRLAGDEAWRLYADRLSHLLVLDDDARLAPTTLGTMCDALARESAGAAYPLVLDAAGLSGWLPGLQHPESRRLQRESLTPDEVRRRLGDARVDFVWAQGICLLVTREAIAAIGVHRDDFWIRGEDMEFSLRITARHRGIFVPETVVEHLPPPETAASLGAAEYLKHCALLQNMDYIALRLPHGRRIAWTLAGLHRRFFKRWGFRVLADAARAFWRGAVLAEPAGRGAGRTFRARFSALPQN